MYERFSPLGLAMQFGTTLRQRGGRAGSRSARRGKARLGSSDRGEGGDVQRGGLIPGEAHFDGGASIVQHDDVLPGRHRGHDAPTREVAGHRRRGCECCQKVCSEPASSSRVSRSAFDFLAIWSAHAKTGLIWSSVTLPIGATGDNPRLPSRRERSRRSRWALIFPCSRACGSRTRGCVALRPTLRFRHSRVPAFSGLNRDRHAHRFLSRPNTCRSPWRSARRP